MSPFFDDRGNLDKLFREEDKGVLAVATSTCKRHRVPGAATVHVGPNIRPCGTTMFLSEET